MSLRNLRPFIVALLFLSACSNSTSQEQKPNVIIDPETHMPAPEARLLNDSACRILQENPYDTLAMRTALLLLEQSVQADTAYYVAYTNKRSTEFRLGEYEAMLETSLRMVALNPMSPIAITNLGIDYEWNGNSEKAKSLYEQSLALSNTILDTMSSSNSKRFRILMNKAGTLILLNRPDEAATAYDKAAAACTDKQERENVLMHKGVERNRLLIMGSAAY